MNNDTLDQFIAAAIRWPHLRKIGAGQPGIQEEIDRAIQERLHPAPPEVLPFAMPQIPEAPTMENEYPELFQ